MALTPPFGIMKTTLNTMGTHVNPSFLATITCYNPYLWGIKPLHCFHMGFGRGSIYVMALTSTLGPNRSISHSKGRFPKNSKVPRPAGSCRLILPVCIKVNLLVSGEENSGRRKRIFLGEMFTPPKFNIAP